MNLSDSRQEPAPGYLFPLAVCAPVGLPGSSTDLSTRAAPFHPEQPGDCSYPLLHRRFQASSSSADWPLLSCVTRPIRVCFYNCGSRVRLTRLRQQNYSRPRLLGYLSNGQLTRYPPFRILDRPGLSWRSEGHEVRKINFRNLRALRGEKSCHIQLNNKLPTARRSASRAPKYY
jgi:hypothetical protein